MGLPRAGEIAPRLHIRTRCSLLPAARDRPERIVPDARIESVGILDHHHEAVHMTMRLRNDVGSARKGAARVQRCSRRRTSSHAVAFERLPMRAQAGKAGTRMDVTMSLSMRLSRVADGLPQNRRQGAVSRLTGTSTDLSPRSPSQSVFGVHRECRA